MDVMMGDELEELEKEKAPAQEEKEAHQLIQQQMLATLNQLNQRLERLEAQPSSAGSTDGSFVLAGSKPSGQAEG